MNYENMLIALNNGETVRRECWNVVKKTIKINLNDASLLDIGFVGMVIDENKTSTIPIGHLESHNDGINDWVVFDV